MKSIFKLLLLMICLQVHPVVMDFSLLKITEIKDFKLKIKVIEYPEIKQHRELIFKYSRMYKLPPRLVNNILGHESGFNTQAINYNWNGSIDMGIAQINSKYYQYYKETFLSDLNPWDAESSIHFCTKYLRYLIDHSESYEVAIIAYNRGLQGSKGQGRLLGQKYYQSVVSWSQNE